MCGIAGIMNRNGEPVREETLSAMAGAMIRRGPDGEGVFANGVFGLAHRRLSIIDVMHGGQPIFNEDHTIAVVHNGEIYNFRELRSRLTAHGHLFRTNSDSETIVHLYEEAGLDFPKQLDGMFAIAIADIPKRRLILVTDRAGKKPIFYSSSEKAFRFASTLPALEKAAPFDEGIDPQAVWDYLSFLYVPAPETVYRGISRMLPARLMVVSPDSDYPDIRCWWKPNFAAKAKLSFEDSAANLRELMEDSVEKRLVSDVPLGVFLSGGLDSAVVASLAAELKHGGPPLKCFSIGFEESAYDESKAARANADFISRRTGGAIEFHHRTVKPGDFGLLKLLVSEFGQPFADSSILPTYMLSAFARENVTVALSGDGADELFCGYERYLAMHLLGAFDSIPVKLRSAVCRGLSRFLSSAGGERSFQARLRRLLQASLADPAERSMFLISKFPHSLKTSVLGEAFENFRPSRSERFAREIRGASTVVDATEKAMEFDFHCYLPNDILTKVDTASMTASLEVRCPFLDHRVIEAAAAMPLAYKLRGRLRKRIFGEAFADCIPAGLVSAKKRGFGVPIASWFRGPWKQHLLENLVEGEAVNRHRLFRREAILNMIHQHEFYEADYSYQLFAMLVLELSLRGRSLTHAES